MNAVIKTGGKQYRVSKGDRIRIEKIAGKAGDKLTFNDVLVVGDGEDVKIGSPFIPDVSVEAEIVSQGRGKKIHVFKKKRRKGYKLHKGHRQDYTEVEIKGIGDS